MKDMRCPLDVEIVDILRDYQEREGINVAELAERLGMHPNNLSRLFSPRYQSSLRLESAYEILGKIGLRPSIQVKSVKREKISA